MQKGGVGKTSLSVSLAAQLSGCTKGVLLIDADPQGSATNWIGEQNITAELSDVLFGKIDLKTAIVESSVKGLSLLQSAGLGGELNLYAKTLANQQDRCIKKVVREAAGLGYQYCIIDMSPGFGALEWAVFMACDEVITPVLPDSFAVDGLATFASNLKQFRTDKETELPVYRRILINGIDKRIAKHTEILGGIHEKAGTMLVYEFLVDPAYRKVQAAGLAVQDLTIAKKETLSELQRLAHDIMGG
jgi:chromosome partitioning protein